MLTTPVPRPQQPPPSPQSEQPAIVQHRHAVFAGILLLAILMGWLIDRTGIGLGLDRRLTDSRFCARSNRSMRALGLYNPPAISPDVVIIGEDTKTYQNIPIESKKWNPIYARVVNQLSAAGVKAIGVDHLQPVPLDPPQGDADLAAAYADAPGLVIADVIRGDSSDHSVFAATVGPDHEGAVNVIVDDDGVIRKLPLFVRSGDHAVPSMTFNLVRYATGAKINPADVKPGVPYTVGPYTIPWDDSFLLDVNYAGPGFTLPYISLVDCLDAAKRNDKDWFEKHFKGKIVLMGDAEPVLTSDFKMTPMFGLDHKLMPGVEIHANALNTILTGQYLRHPGPLAGLLILMLCVLAIGGGMLAVPLPVMPAVAVVVLLLELLAGFVVFSHGGWELAMAAPLSGSVLGALGVAWLRFEVARKTVKTIVVQAPRPGRLNEGHKLAGCYRIVKTLGAGGMGSVYLAHDDNLDQDVAIKQMRLEDVDPRVAEKMQEQFRREATILASLSHPGVVRVFHAFEEEPHHYLVMAFVKGTPLSDILERSPSGLPVPEVVRWGLELCSILHYLHTHEPQVIFKDLKPANVMLRDEGSICLVDFGIARMADTKT
ncbi:MAG: CHASE2 domain-containing protein, partial [Candidatus Xenobia bacterium]